MNPRFLLEIIIVTGNLMNRYIMDQTRGMIHASQLIIFTFVQIKKLIHPIWPNISGNILVHAASDANTLENKTKKAPTR
jgi:hypothetical protein